MENRALEGKHLNESEEEIENNSNEWSDEKYIEKLEETLSAVTEMIKMTKKRRNRLNILPIKSAVHGEFSG